MAGENLRKKLEKSGKRAEIVEVLSGLNRIKNPDQFEKIQIGNGKVGKSKEWSTSTIPSETVKKMKIDLNEEDFDVICSHEDSDDHKLRNKMITMKGKGLKQKGSESIDLESVKSFKNRYGENGGSEKCKNGGFFGLGKLLGIVKNGRKERFESSAKRSGESGGEKPHGKSAKKVAAKKKKNPSSSTQWKLIFTGKVSKNPAPVTTPATGGEIRNKGQMGHGEEKTSQVSNIPVVQGLPDQSGSSSAHPYDQQHMPIMINQQRADAISPAAYSQSFLAAYHGFRQQPMLPPRWQSES